MTSIHPTSMQPRRPSVQIHRDSQATSAAAAIHAAKLIRQAISGSGRARILVATGASQIAFLQALVRYPRIDWSSVEMFHLDEYIGLPVSHPASFRRYLLDRLIGPAGIRHFHLLDGETDPAETCVRVGRALQSAPIDLAFAGIGENGHIAFNDPPADFETTAPYHVVALDEACRRQQFTEGWFQTIADVPRRAISISVRQLMRARSIVSVVPDHRKAQAVKRCLEGEITPLAPASALQLHPACTVFLDHDSASLLSSDGALAGAPVPPT